MNLLQFFLFESIGFLMLAFINFSFDVSFDGLFLLMKIGRFLSQLMLVIMVSFRLIYHIVGSLGLIHTTRAFLWRQHIFWYFLSWHGIVVGSLRFRLPWFRFDRVFDDLLLNGLLWFCLLNLRAVFGRILYFIWIRILILEYFLFRFHCRLFQGFSFLFSFLGLLFLFGIHDMAFERLVENGIDLSFIFFSL